MSFWNRLRCCLSPVAPPTPTPPQPVHPPTDNNKPAAANKPSKIVDPRDGLFVKPASTKINRHPIRQRIAADLSDVLFPQVAAIVESYAIEVPYTWTADPYYPAITITDNVAISRSRPEADDNQWIRIVAAQSLAVGSNRWRILTEYDSSSSSFLAGYIAIGVSNADAGCTLLTNGTEWKDLSTSTDFLVSTSNGRKDTRHYIAELFLAGQSFYTEFGRKTAKRTITLVEVDTVGRTMSVSFRCHADAIRVLTVSLPASDVWRPCVTVCGAVTATILDWLDDY